MSRARSTQQTTVALEIEVEIRGVRDVLVDDSTGGAVSTAVAFSLVRGEEPGNGIRLANHVLERRLTGRDVACLQQQW
jgi:hypothetical protein